MSQMNLSKAFVLGHPIAQSRSPKIHNFWLEHLQIQGSYEALDILGSDLDNFLSTFQNQGFVGGNVTAPHKEQTFRFVEKNGRLAEAALKIGAVNTLYFDNDQLVGDNTDALGFIANLNQWLEPHWMLPIQQSLVIGAGGAARAVIVGLLENTTGSIVIANRTRERAASLLSLDSKRLTVCSWADIEDALATSDLIVNTTTLGMDDTQASLPFSLSVAKKTAIATDLVYVPLETPFLKAAKESKLKQVDGLGMLLHQAVPGFTRWFGKKPVVSDALRNRILDDLYVKSDI